MKQLLKFLTLAAMLCIPWVTQAQTEVEIGNGTSAGYYTPIGTYYSYSITEQLYTSTEIGTAGTISSIAFNYAVSSAKDFPIHIYMKQVDAADLSTGISFDDGVEVFDGTVSVSAAGWVTIDLDNPFVYDGSSNLLIGVIKDYVQWFSGSTWVYTSVANMARYSQNDSDGAYTSSTVPGTSTNNRPNIKLWITAGSGPVCERPATLEASTVTATGATLTWTGGSGTYNVEYKKQSDADWTHLLTNSTLLTTNLTGLDVATDYQVRVQSVCSGETSSWKTVSFTTECDVFSAAGFTQNFDLLTGVTSYYNASNNLPQCWNYINTTGTTSYQGLPVVYANGSYSTYAYSAPNCLYFYSYYSGSNDPQPQYAILPPMNDLAGMQVTLQARGYNTASTFKIGTMSNPANASTFTLIAEQTGLTTSYQEFEYLVPPTNTDAYLAIMIEAASSSRTTNGVYIDDISINTPPTCIKPTGLEVEGSGRTATLTWTAGEGTAWDVAYATSSSDDPDANIVGSATTATYSMDNLTIDADHYFWVRTDCGSNGTSQWTGPVSVHIGYCVPSPTSHDGSGITAVSFGTGSYVVNNGDGTASLPASSPFYGDYTSMIGAVNAGVESTIAITTSTGSYPYTFVIWVDLDNNMSFEDSEVLYIGKASSGAGTLNATITIPATQALGDYRMRIYGADSYFTSFYGNGTTNWSAAHDPCASGSYRHAHDYTLRVLDAPSCLTPTGLTVNYTGGDEATVSWTSEAMAWNLDVNGTVTAITENPYTLTGLSLATAYDVMVQADCGANGTSDWTAPVSFTTDLCLPADQCNISYSFTDQYDDSWNGASISVVDVVTSIEIANLTMPSDSDPYEGTFAVCDGREIKFVWTKGSYPGETGFVFTDINGEEILNVAQGSAPTSNGDLLSSYTVSCIVTNCRKPSDLTASNVKSDNVDLSWTENGVATEWVVAYKADADADFNVVTTPDPIIAGSNITFNLDGLDPNTHYTVKVRPVCSDAATKWSDAIGFTTLEACAKPTGVAASDITNNSATISWTGDDEFTLKYRLPAHTDGIEESFGPSIPSGWTNMTGLLENVMSSSATLASGTQWSFGTNNGVFDNHARINIFGSTRYGWLITPEITLPVGATMSFDLALTAYSGTLGAPATTGTDDRFVVLVYADDVWHILREWNNSGSTTYVYNDIPNTATGETVDDIDISAYVGKTVKFAFYGESTASNADNNLHIDNVVIGAPVAAGNWVEVDVSTATSHDITGLAAETKYEVVIVPDCDADKTSDPYFFTTVAGITKDITANQWYAIASPVHDDGQTYESFTNVTNLTSDTYDLLRWDEEYGTWETSKPDVIEEFAQGYGYIYRRSTTETLTFVGQRNSGNFSKYLYTYCEDANLKGFHLLGNPYPKAYTPTVAYYKLNPNGTWTVNTASTGSVAVAEGFFVKKASAGYYYFYEPTGAKSAPRSNAGTLAFTVSNDEYSDVAYARFGEGEDMPKMSHLNPAAPALSIPQGDRHYAIATLDESTESFPLAFNGNGEYTLTASNLDGLSYLHLIDRATGRDIDLLSTPSYSFYATGSADRFTVKLTPSMDKEGNVVFVRVSDSRLIVDGTGLLQVFDVMGRQLGSARVDGTTTLERSSLGIVSAGVYVLRLEGNSQKIVVK